MMKLSTSFPRSLGRMDECETEIRVLGRSVPRSGRARKAGEEVVVVVVALRRDWDWEEVMRDVEEDDEGAVER
jgi:hypothetical protein